MAVNCQIEVNDVLAINLCWVHDEFMTDFLMPRKTFICLLLLLLYFIFCEALIKGLQLLVVKSMLN